MASDYGLYRDQIHRAYLQKGLAWFSEFPNWLEYSIAKDAAFCLCCYLFKADIGDQTGGDSFVDVKVVAFSNAPQNLKLTSPDIQKDIVNVATFDLGIEHVANTNALSLKQAVENLFSRLGLSISKLRGQGYDGASNMQAMAKNHNQIALFFTLVSNVVNAVGASCKSRDIVREKQAAKVAEALNTRKLSSGQSLNQETNLKRAGDTRWGSHYGTLVSLASMFSTMIDVLERISEDGLNSEQRAEANLQKMRESGWTSLLDDILSFCEKHEIDFPQMEDMFVAQGRKRHNAQEITNLHHYRVELFYTVLDMQIQELNARFTESNIQLLLCVACLNPSNFFSSFDGKKLIHLAEFYPKEFSLVELIVLDTYIIDMLSSSEFSMLNGIAYLAKKMVETGRDKVYPLVYFLLTLALILPIATVTVERVFSAMNIVKNRLRNQMGDGWMNE
ncbi:uncharacterized protein LOC114278337 [Camellia sinensis]|uniref:uncharacterized protein LOC114278337 n=1 Tax=Camellia sinensis TaxID=4442 RepID=UPI0010355AA6|nr:uncharacterized protein LOC114278337 [Camellia sinensis]